MQQLSRFPLFFAIDVLGHNSRKVHGKNFVTTPFQSGIISVEFKLVGN